MAKIRATTTFLHDRDRYKEGTEHDVPDALAAYFVLNGWATSDDVAELAGTPPQEVTLDIKPARHASRSTTPGS